MEEVLVTHMNNNQWTLDRVLDKFIKGEKIKTSMSATWTMKQRISCPNNVFNYNKNGQPIITPVVAKIERLIDIKGIE